MKNEALTFERAFSELGRLQQAMTIGYRLCWQEKTAVFELRCTRRSKDRGAKSGGAERQPRAGGADFAVLIRKCGTDGKLEGYTAGAGVPCVIKRITTSSGWDRGS